MKQIDRLRLKKLIVFALLFVGCCFSVFSLSVDDSLLLALTIEQATDVELEAMVQLRNLPVGTPQKMRSSLYSYHGITELTLDEGPSTKQAYTLTILNADSVYNDRSKSSLVVLNGNAMVEFTLTDEKQAKKLSADKMVVDLENTLLIAYGGVVYDEGGGEASVQTVTGDIVTLNWTSKSLLVTGGTTTTERKNSEDETVRFYTTGDLISYNGSGDGIFFDKGFITTNKKNAYSSITAENLAFLSGGDLLVKNAYLSIGRVPVFWVPAFFIPGVRMVGNPAIGFTSDRGMFLNTTFEMYGTYPHFKKAEGSSFTSLLAGEENSSYIPDGPIYGPREGEMTPFEQWTAQSGSYLVLLADSYEHSGITIGMEAHHSFFSKKIILDNDMHLAVHPEGKDSLGSFADFPKVRIFGNNKFVVDTSWADLSITMPFYSDPSVRRLYGNRLTAFSFDSLFGKRQEFPSDFSDVNSFSWKANGSFNFPTAAFGKYIRQAKITTINATIDWQWGLDATTNLYSYSIRKVTLPELQATISGELFSWSKPLREKKKAEPIQVGQEGSDSELKSKAPFSLDATLDRPFIPTLAKKTKVSSTGGKQSITLGYSLDEKLIYSVANLEDANTTWDTNKNIYTSTNPALTLDMVLHPSFFTFKQKLSSPFITSEDRTKATYLTRQLQLLSATNASVPLIGLTYTLEGKLYTFRDSQGLLYESNSTTFEFTKEHVTKHQLRIAKNFTAGEGTLSPSITATLYPLTQSLLPALGYAIGPWAFTTSLKFIDQGGDLVPQLLSSSGKFSTTVITISLLGTYDMQKLANDRWAPLTLSGNALLQLFGKRFTLKESFNFEAYSSLYGPDYFKDITTTVSIPSVTATLVYAGPSDALYAESLTTQVALKDLSYVWWKRRIALKMALDAKLNISFIDTYATSLSLTAKVGFSIAEFLDFSFSLTSSNRGFYRYYDGQDFSFPKMWEDLLRSFDLVGGGRNATQFNMNSIAIELIHYMEDWSLNCKYTGSVVLSENQYKWVPVVSVFLQWKTIPELKVDEKWTESSNGWVQSASS